MNARIDAANIRKINSAHGTDWCAVCCRPANSPYIRRDGNGAVVEGCVNATHAHFAEIPGAYRTWFFRPSAQRCRAGLVKYVR